MSLKKQRKRGYDSYPETLPQNLHIDLTAIAGVHCSLISPQLERKETEQLNFT
jgi:hypothetical protein